MDTGFQTDLQPGLGDEPRRKLNEDFRQHYGFLALMLVCVACTVYLMGVLRSILRPFLWALFLVMGLTPGVAFVERFLLCTTSYLCRCSAATLRWFCKSCRWICGYLGTCELCWRRGRDCTMNLRICAKRRAHRREFSGKPSVIGSSTSDDHRTITPNTPNNGGSGDSAAGERETLDSDFITEHSWGPCARRIVHAVAIAAVVAAVIGAICGFVLMVIQSVLSLQEHWDIYKQGARNVFNSVQNIVVHITGSMPREIADEIASNTVARAEELLSALLGEVLGNLWRFVLEFLMMVLYIAFWLSDPMPVGSKMEELFKRYIILKGLACLGYGVCVGVLLQALGVDLAAAFGLAAFLLSFVPEVGSIVALLLPAPVILFDSRLKSPAMTLTIATLAQLGLKFVFANVVEVKLVEADQLMKMHPVIILLAVTFFGYIWGPTGMLLSVPLVAYLKVALLSDKVPPRYRDPVLVILEGDRNAPFKYAESQCNSS